MMKTALKSPVKQSLNNIKRTPTFKKSGNTGKQLAQDFSSFRRTLVIKNNRLKKVSKKDALPTNRQIDKESLKILGQLQNRGGGGLGAAIGSGLG